MKKLIIAALAVITLTTSAFADSTTTVSRRVLNSFKADFKNATGIEWVVKEDFCKASFLHEGVKMEAFYDLEGNVIGTSKAIAENQLPAAAQKKLAEKYAGYTMTEAIEFDKANEGIRYYVSLTRNSKTIVLQVETNGTVSFFK
jgi:hypothetical protein